MWTAPNEQNKKGESSSKFVLSELCSEGCNKNANHCHSFVELGSHALFCEALATTSMFVNWGFPKEISALVSVHCLYNLGRNVQTIVWQRNGRFFSLFASLKRRRVSTPLWLSLTAHPLWPAAKTAFDCRRSSWDTVQGAGGWVGMLLRISSIFSRSTLRIYFLFLVLVSKYEIDRKILSFSFKFFHLHSNFSRK